jgi:hypothetical protein
MQTAWARSAHSYCSQSAKILTFGLGGATQAETLEVAWPSGKLSRLSGVAAGSRVTVREADAAAAVARAAR